MPNWLRPIALISTGVGFDQLTKWIARSVLYNSPGIPFTPLLKFQLVFNPGAAYGIFAGQQFPLLIISLTVLFAIAFFWEYLTETEWQTYGTIFLIIGALGNFIDRFQYGVVTDFINIHIFPVFNIADIAINIAVACYLVDTIQSLKQNK
ncbi:signal peptidase II [bacterium]|jgi:signal peptidase II|nr:signal peptidase II [bacterium]